MTFRCFRGPPVVPVGAPVPPYRADDVRVTGYDDMRVMTMSIVSIERKKTRLTNERTNNLGERNCFLLPAERVTWVRPANRGSKQEGVLSSSCCCCC